ncbi:ferric-dicitrate binding protein FerR (iron transport regulator) [Dyadobacter sp. BE34]|uniref:Ferric-dicitrate binding protein FerR (Iron transport regulator) n=1 Tax=Dyadobacter fermentans TaxID=94254 RepID=A0ABU1R210_9BACT|nr:MULTISPECIES: FecR domain-containing protein [Dyadobacter]MDR6807454.1 ferric-dicitrate binding protein FerR (iron transport regulator) [Dyadobacter fermentans]MDR7045195.1 ferric-dicitrate binding protein FerR (iron transport regulator) [Dyadobacter sp. BE242]MDR7199068.1 ferric-dicitrate binding protein FerR (iron transport regulator) [Dyadobacter sp. BE34]MDR7217028.1 ferric-dicitrate binding protein FerR (iron transport regulator) [Dyadobacter sp. BE31]MDR7264961.1 ferric-dicitrate bind
MKPNGIPPALLEKYLSGACTEAEKEIVEAWYASLQGEPRYLDHLPDAEQNEIRQEAFGNIRRELNFGEEEPVQTSLWRALPWRLVTGIAASVAIVLGVYLAVNLRTIPQPDITAKTDTKTAPLPITVFENTGMQIVRHELPDGSVVTMHPNAVIEYRAGFANNKRFVAFSGEGFFDVKKDKTRPFNIKSGDMVIRVLGTSFNVKAVKNQKKFQVDVVTGSVQVTAQGESFDKQEVILKPQQQALFELDSKRLISKTLPTQAKKEIYEPLTIVFEETPLNKVIEQLEKRFNVSISLANPGLAKCGLTANFESQTFSNILEILCTSLEVTYTISDNNITINGEPCE